MQAAFAFCRAVQGCSFDVKKTLEFRALRCNSHKPVDMLARYL